MEDSDGIVERHKFRATSVERGSLVSLFSHFSVSFLSLFKFLALVYDRNVSVHVSSTTSTMDQQQQQDQNPHQQHIPHDHNNPANYTFYQPEQEPYGLPYNPQMAPYQVVQQQQHPGPPPRGLHIILFAPSI
jgi:hypothetical protein